MPPEEAIEAFGDIPILTVEEPSKRQRIPDMRWADERQWCRDAIARVRPAACPMFAADEDRPSG